MAYQTYITEALVCGSRASHTSDRSYLLFARDAGMLYATARSVREERSKQRFALQEFSHIRVTLIHGKSGWRIAGVEPIQNLYTPQTSREARAFLRNIVRLLRRVMHGETPHEMMFDDVLQTLMTPSMVNYQNVECILSLRILSALGYVATQPQFSKFLEAPSVTVVVDMLDESTYAVCSRVIEEALAESHL